MAQVYWVKLKFRKSKLSSELEAQTTASEQIRIYYHNQPVIETRKHEISLQKLRNRELQKILVSF